MFFRALLIVTAGFTFSTTTALPASADRVAALGSPAASVSQSYAGFGPHVVLHGAAPGDEYFGPLAMSVFGIRNTLRDASARADATGIDRYDKIATVLLVERSIRAWEAKYPHDAWLPASVFALRTVYHELGTTDSDWRAADTAAWLMSKYGESTEARSLRAALRQENTASRPAAATPQPSVANVAKLAS